MPFLPQISEFDLVSFHFFKANEALAQDSYYQALKTLETIEREHLPAVPSARLKAYIESQIPICRSHVERRVNLEFQDWLVQIRAISREIGKSAIGQAAASRQREMDLAERQRQAEEQVSPLFPSFPLISRS